MNGKMKLTFITRVAGTGVVFNKISTVRSVLTWQGFTVINVYLAMVSFKASVCAVTGVAVDAINTLALVLAWSGLSKNIYQIFNKIRTKAS